MEKYLCNSGGADGSDTVWETVADAFGFHVNSWSYQTRFHQSKFKVELSTDDYFEGVEKVTAAARKMGRRGIEKYMNLLARNWAQVKYSEAIYAIGKITRQSRWIGVAGGTGYAVQMAIDHGKPVFVFDLDHNTWKRWNGTDFEKVENLKLQHTKFAGIGTREITQAGIQAIAQLFIDTFMEISMHLPQGYTLRSQRNLIEWWNQQLQQGETQADAALLGAIQETYPEYTEAKKLFAYIKYAALRKQADSQDKI